MDGGVTDTVRVTYRKYPDTLHWHFDTRRLGTDEHGIWLALDAGAWARRGTEPPKTQPDLSVFVVPHEAWWSAIFNRSGSARLYVDINTPPQWTGSEVTMIDLDLDIRVRRDTPDLTELLDEDEFEAHREQLAYPPRFVDGARAAAAEMFLWVDSGREPFGVVADEWMRRADRG